MSLEMTRASMQRSILSGAVVAGLLAFGVGGWAATAELAGAVIAPGLLVVESDVKKVQHPTGGVVGELRVRDGYRVKAGDVLVRLDDTQTRAALGIVTKALDELAARRARNEAERDDAGTIQFPAELLARTDDPDVAKLVHGEERLFEARRSARFGKARQLRERIGQLLEQVQGLADQLTAKRKEIELIGQELSRTLAKKLDPDGSGNRARTGCGSSRRRAGRPRINDSSNPGKGDRDRVADRSDRSRSQIRGLERLG